MGMLPDSLAALKCGVSPSPPRIHRPTATNTMEAMNGMRQPHVVRNSVPNAAIAAKAAEASNMPIVMPIWGTEPNRPRFLGGAYS
ncbi:hypothetical protein GCM10009824_16160 [Kocuria atrinae]|uniref:Uncharacterized protein n=1 Tax=Kocuria atrinae TaxID=592377 RepID=A0ABN2XVC5_9MICC